METLNYFLSLLVYILEYFKFQGEEKINLNILQPTFEEEIETQKSKLTRGLKLNQKEKKFFKNKRKVVKFKSFRQNNC